MNKKFNKDFDIIDHYSPQDLNILNTYFKQNIYLINYDDNKEPIDQGYMIDYRNVYVVKAKDQYLIAVKLPEIKQNNAKKDQKVSHEELAWIFDIQNRLENSPVKVNKIEGTS